VGTSAGANTIDIGYSLSAGTPATIATASTPGSAVYSTSALNSYESNIVSGSDFSPLDLGATTSETPGSASGQDLSTVSITTIPETSTWAMMVLGFAGLGYAGFR